MVYFENAQKNIFRMSRCLECHLSIYGQPLTRLLRNASEDEKMQIAKKLAICTIFFLVFYTSPDVRNNSFVRDSARGKIDSARGKIDFAHGKMLKIDFVQFNHKW